ncbi:fibronectin type III domain-containing protein [Luteolibacter luteus]|uniref:Fibronectin type III domain-containing protein n=1 Tax=Luteolibacter luteus TaxID=2728835 RepID=A0A858RF33_9BACT|nr:fibronectin type III domain-containing protein [Luteolibacter luteus]QJE95174.1 fibronectin type III domain-containing protein [Luteolibacter luteus]
MRLLAFLFLLISAVTASAQNTPTNLTATAISDGDVKLEWVAPTGVTPLGYHVYRAVNVGGEFGTPLTTAGQVTGLSFTDTTATTGITYKYVVRWYSDSAGTIVSNPSNEATATPVATPGAPSNLRQVKVTGTTATIQWNSVTGAESYIIYRDGDEVGEVDAPTTVFTDSGLTGETPYIYVVTAFSAAGGESTNSNSITVTTTAGDGSGRNDVWARRFRLLDTDADKLITFEEYARKQAARQAWVIAAHRWAYMDYDASGDVDLTEYAKSLGGRKFLAPSKPRAFLLADGSGIDGDRSGDLSFDEFRLTVGSKLKESQVQKMFDKKNKNRAEGNEYLSEVEFGIKNGSTKDDGEPLPPDDEE